MIDDALRTALADRYRIEREIGAGGMATVYLAEDLKHHRKVALKVLRPELSAQLGPERFLHEIALTASLQNPHIVPLFDSGAIDASVLLSGKAAQLVRRSASACDDRYGRVLPRDESPACASD
jgi:hypothetical protein